MRRLSIVASLCGESIDEIAHMCAAIQHGRGMRPGSGIVAQLSRKNMHGRTLSQIDRFHEWGRRCAEVTGIESSAWMFCR